MKIIGWTCWDDPNYTEMFEDVAVCDTPDIAKVKSIIAEELRSNGFRFDGRYHQGGETGVPVFDNNHTFQCSMRVWGEIMAEAYPEEIDNSDGYGYLVWAWNAPGPMAVPTKGQYA